MTPKRPPKARPCVWRYLREAGDYDTGCGNSVRLEGTIKENDIRFCPFCGRPLKEAKEK